MYKPRLSQQEVIQFNKGRMGVSAVPGSGKTHTLSFLAARLIAEGMINDDQEILIVTLVNSAVDNFAQRIAEFMREKKLLPYLGYRIRTLHGLAHDIVKERPDLLGLSEQFSIADERDTGEIIANITEHWIRTHTEFLDQFVDPAQNRNDRKIKRGIDTLISSLANSYIKQAKDLELSPTELEELIDAHSSNLPLIKMGVEIYQEYQHALNLRGAVDFEDLIRMALKALNQDHEYLSRLQNRWPIILEDEAQDSSQLQEKILRLLVGNKGSWVRVGDPNQAIYESFTTASPKYLKNFLLENGVKACSLPHSGRSTASIVQVANHLIHWTQDEHPVIEIRDALTPPYIELTPADDPQPNPVDYPAGIRLIQNKLEPAEEIQQIVRSIKNWLADHKENTVAVLVPRNDRGSEVVEALKENDIECVELLHSSHPTRQIANIFAKILSFIKEPVSSNRLAEVFESIHSFKYDSADKNELIKRTVRLLQRIRFVEEFFSPIFEFTKYQSQDDSIPEWWLDILIDFREKIIYWQQAALLPIDQFILTLSTQLFQESGYLAIAYKIASLLANDKHNHPHWGITEMIEIMEAITKNKVKLLGFSSEDIGFDPDHYQGKVVVATIHKAKGLEWDKVYLISVNNYDFPSSQDFDTYIAEKWFIRDQLNLEAETIMQLKALASRQLKDDHTLGEATKAARMEYSAERIRLLYVGITRARKELVITWNSGKRGQCVPAIPLQALFQFWKEKYDSAN